MSVRTWIRANARVYHDNPTAARDFRAQLRGNKAIALWSAYLILLIALSVTFYGSIHAGSLTQTQQTLKNFYESTMEMLAGAICLITPALTAGTIVVERQRKSLDLLFSAPVSYKGLLVGKLISSYRYTLMLLVLSIPVVSVAVVMGGATWQDVLRSYAILSFDALIFTSIGLLISSLTETVGAAIIWTYLAVGLYLAVSSTLLAASSVRSLIGSGDVGWQVGLNPFLAMKVPSGAADWGFVHVPNWIMIAVLAVVICRLFVLGSASILSPYGSADSKAFRVNSVVYLFLLCVWLRWTEGGLSAETFTFGLVVAVTSFLLIFIPYIVCFADGAGRKYGPGVSFEFRKILTGARSGSLPYLLLLWLAIMLGTALGSLFGPSTSRPPFYFSLGSSAPIITFVDEVHRMLDAGAWSAGFLLMWWALGRWVSAFAKSLKSARALTIALMILIILVPLPLIGIFDPNNTGLLKAHIYYPLVSLQYEDYAPIYGVAMAAVGLVFWGLASARARERASLAV